MERSTLLVAAALLSYQLFLPPVVGLANNGDFGKVIGVFGMGAPPEEEFHYVSTTYTFEPRYRFNQGFYSSEMLLAAAALGLNKVFSKTPTFDLRWIGAVHAGLLLLALAMTLPMLRGLSRRARVLLSAVPVLLFTDALYATHFNSFYMDAGAFVFLALAVSFYLRVRQWQRAVDIAGLLFSCVLLVTAKTQHTVLALPIAGLLAWEFGRSGRCWLAVTSAAAVLGAAAACWQAVPPYYAPVNAYNVIFLRIVPTARNAPAELRELGLDESYCRYSGTHSYQSDSPMQNPAFVREFGRRASYVRLARFFLTHPARTWRVLKKALDRGGRVRPVMGNFDRSAGLPAGAETRAWAWWSGLKRMAFEGHGSRYVFFALFLWATLLVVARPKAPAFALAAMALLEMCATGLADAMDDARHFFLFHALIDITVVAAVTIIASGGIVRKHTAP